MSRGLETAVKLLLNALALPSMVVTFEFETQGLRLTNWPRTITVGGKTYTGAKASADEFVITGKGFGENLRFEAVTAVIEIASLNGWAQAKFFNDVFREDTCVVTILYVSGSSFVSTGWATRYKCDAEECSADKVNIRLGSLDAVTGTEAPRRTTQADGCQSTFQVSDETGGCPFRWSATAHSAALATCDRTYDGPNGCVAHFPPLTDPVTGQSVPRLKPYGGFLGAVDHRLVRAGG